MKKFLPKAIALAGVLLPFASKAQDYYDDYYYDDYGTSTDAAIGAGLGIGLIILWIVAMVVGLAFFVFWVIMLVDCVKRQFEQRSTWLAVLIVGFFLGFHWLASILYFFLVKRKNLGTKAPKPAAPAAPAAPKEE